MYLFLSILASAVSPPWGIFLISLLKGERNQVVPETCCVNWLNIDPFLECRDSWDSTEVAVYADMEREAIPGFLLRDCNMTVLEISPYQMDMMLIIFFAFPSLVSYCTHFIY